MRNGTAKCMVLQIWKQSHDGGGSKGNESGDCKKEKSATKKVVDGGGAVTAKDKGTEQGNSVLSDVKTLEELEKSLRADLAVDFLEFDEIKNVRDWQKSLKLLPSYL